MAARTPNQFLRSVLDSVARRAVTRVKPLIPSDTLRDSLRVQIERMGQEFMAHLFIPHYWAVYLHDGRAGFSKAPGDGFLVFFRDPSKDPRLRGGYPVRASQVRRLSENDWRKGLKANRDHMRAGGSRFTAPMIVVKKVGPADANRFFEDGMRGFLASDAAPAIRRAFDRYVQEVIDRDHLHERRVATVRL